METLYFRDRLILRYLWQKHPHWSLERLADAVNRSVSWVKKWLKRFKQAEPDDDSVLHSQSRRPKTCRQLISDEAVKVVLSIRDNPPKGIKRVPGPETIQYYLHQTEEFTQLGLYLPRSTSTIWAILDAHQRIVRPPKVDHEPLSLAEPLQHWQLDFKDVTCLKLADSDKQQHQLETLNIIDCGTSILIDNQASTTFNAEMVVDSLVKTFERWGVPSKLQFDRDSRFIGSWTADDFPSPVMQMLLCLGIELEICPPHRPDKNCYVERLNRTYQEEGIAIYLPQTLEQVVDMNHDFACLYNYFRPHQGLACGNQPPRTAFPELPSLPPLPTQVDPDAWLSFVDGQVYRRRINASGTVKLGKHDYYIARKLKGHQVLLQVTAESRTVSVLLDGQSIKTMPLKGLVDMPLAWTEYLPLIRTQAISAWRHYLAKARRYSD